MSAYTAAATHRYDNRTHGRIYFQCYSSVMTMSWRKKSFLEWRSIDGPRYVEERSLRLQYWA